MKTNQFGIALGPRFNDLDAFIEEVMLPEMGELFIQNTPFLKTVFMDTAGDVKDHGDKLKVQMPFDLGEADEMAIDGESTATPYSAQTVEMVLDKHLYKEFKMSDRAWVTHNSGNTLPSLAEAAAKSVALSVNKHAIDMTRDVYNFIGTANGNSRSANDVIDLADFLDGVCPEDNRYLGLNRKTNGDLLKEMKDMSKFGREEVQKGRIGEYQGFNVFKDIGLPTIASGGAGSTYTIAADTLAGSTKVQVATGSAPMNRGEVLTIAGVPGTYRVDADYAGGAGELSIFPGLADVAVATAAVTVQDSHPMDIGYHNSAFAVVFRALEVPQDVDGIYSYTHPKTGIPFRLLKWYDRKSTMSHWKLDVLCGFKAIRPEWACRMLAG